MDIRLEHIWPIITLMLLRTNGVSINCHSFHASCPTVHLRMCMSILRGEHVKKFVYNSEMRSAVWNIEMKVTMPRSSDRGFVCVTVDWFEASLPNPLRPRVDPSKAFGSDDSDSDSESGGQFTSGFAYPLFCLLVCVVLID